MKLDTMISANLEETKDNLENMTPMLKQYFTLKHQVPDAILFFRMGDFYEIFGRDAEEVAPILEIVLTSREKLSADKTSDSSYNGNRIPFCGVPHHSAKNYWLKLLKKGKKLAIADQVEDPNLARGLVKREIIKVLSPGVIDELEGLESDSNNYLLGLYQKPGSDQWVVVAIEVSVGELRCGYLSTIEEVLDFVKLISPREILTRRIFRDELRKALLVHFGDSSVLIGDLSEGLLRNQDLHGSFINSLVDENTKSWIDADALGLISAMLSHLQVMKVAINVFKTVRPLKDPETMHLDESVIRDLEIFESSRRRETEGTLYRVINTTLSPMGARLLRKSLIEPLRNPVKIQDRLNLVNEFFSLGEDSLSTIRSNLKGIPDLERLSLRLATAFVAPTDLAKIRTALRKIRQLSDFLNEKNVNITSFALPLSIETLDLLCALENALEDQPQVLGIGCGVFKNGYDQELDQKRTFALEGEELTAAYQTRLREETGISSLKIKPQKNYGLLIEVTKTNRGKIPSAFIHKQTMVNSDRFTTVELQELSEKLDSAQEQCVEREKILYDQLLNSLRPHSDALREMSKLIGYLDMLASFAWNALKNRYVSPQWSDGPLILKGSRHPVVEKFVGEYDFCANDIVLDDSNKQILITGPNMAGKSTLMRQVALSALLAQIGSFVPASVAILPIFDRIFTRVGASDDLARGQSTFMVEMSEASQILRSSTHKSLVILDEIGRGTSSQDGLALAAAILQDISDRIGCYAFFATHYHELVDFSKSLPSVGLMQTEVVERGESILFTHRLVPGSTSSSYGIEVARIAGIPSHVVENAKKIASVKDATQTKVKTPENSVDYSEKNLKKRKKNSQAQLPLENNGILTFEIQGSPDIAARLERIRQINLYRITPLQALNILSELQEEVVQVWETTRHSEQMPI